MRDKITAGKRAREAVEQSNSTTTTTAPAVSPTQPEARRQSVTRELLTSTETQQLDITARDAVRLRREVPATTEEADHLRQKYEIVTGKGDPATKRRIEKTTVVVLYTRPVKKPVFSTDGSPAWFNRLRGNLERANSTYLQPLQMTTRLIRQRPGRFSEYRLQ